MSDHEEALRLYARQVVLELTRSLANYVEDYDLRWPPTDDDVAALEAGREFLVVTELSA